MKNNRKRPRKTKTSSTHSKKTINFKQKCPKCGATMVYRVCTKCHYSARTAYKSRREAKEFTFPAD